MASFIPLGKLAVIPHDKTLMKFRTEVLDFLQNLADNHPCQVTFDQVQSNTLIFYVSGNPPVNFNELVQEKYPSAKFIQQEHDMKLTILYNNNLESSRLDNSTKVIHVKTDSNFGKKIVIFLLIICLFLLIYFINTT